MRFLVDECTGSRVARWLVDNGFEALSVFDDMRGVDDISLLEYSVKNKLILITNDKDFGELVYNRGFDHKGVILLRLDDQRSQNKIAVLEKFLISHKESVENNFSVVTERSVRIIRSQVGSRENGSQ